LRASDLNLSYGLILSEVNQKMGLLVPFRDINVHASASHYAFTSPSSPAAQTLVVERPSGDLRLNDGALLGAKRVSSIAGILGMIKLRLGQELPCHVYLS